MTQPFQTEGESDFQAAAVLLNALEKCCNVRVYAKAGSDTNVPLKHR